MEHKGVEYRVVQTANPTGWKWTIEWGNDTTTTGKSSHSRSDAIFNAVRTIDRAIKSPPIRRAE
jgi:hypothetical protein